MEKQEFYKNARNDVTGPLAQDYSGWMSLNGEEGQ